MVPKRPLRLCQLTHTRLVFVFVLGLGVQLLEPLRRLQAEASIIALPIVPIVKEPVVQIDGEPSNGKAGVRIATKGGKGKAGTGKASKGKAGGGKAVGTITSSSPSAPPSRAPSPPPSIIPRARPVIAPSPPPTPSPPPSILPSARPVIAPTPPPTNKPAEVISSSSGLESIRGENLLVGADTSSSKRVAAGSLCVVGLLVGFIMP
jgi:hypothetical protein